MQQRRVRLGDILDDYCPRERRITNHAVVAMIEDEVKQTRCTTCDADHEYKQAKAPASRRKKPESALVAGTEAAAFARPPVPDPEPPVVVEEALTAPVDLLDVVPAAEAVDPDPVVDPESDPESEPEVSDQPDDVWVHRPLIRATLPRPEGQVPERKAPDQVQRKSADEGKKAEQDSKAATARRKAPDAGGKKDAPARRKDAAPKNAAGDKKARRKGMVADAGRKTT